MIKSVLSINASLSYVITVVQQRKLPAKTTCFSGLIPFVLNIFEKYRSQLQKETSSGLGDVLVAIEDAADSTDVRSSSQSVEGLETDSEELPGVSVSENGDSEYLVVKEGETVVWILEMKI